MTNANMMPRTIMKKTTRVRIDVAAIDDGDDDIYDDNDNRDNVYDGDVYNVAAAGASNDG
jgi:hypothetical protein